MAQTEQALFHKGLQRTLDHTPSGAVAAGAFVFFGTGLNRFVTVANAAIAANSPGTLEFAGVYKVKKKSGATFAIGDMVGWDIGNGEAVVSSDGTLDVELGVCVGAGTADYVLCVINQARGWETSGL